MRQHRTYLTWTTLQTQKYLLVTWSSKLQRIKWIYLKQRTEPSSNCHHSLIKRLCHKNLSSMHHTTFKLAHTNFELAHRSKKMHNVYKNLQYKETHHAVRKKQKTLIILQNLYYVIMLSLEKNCKQFMQHGTEVTILKRSKSLNRWSWSCYNNFILVAY